MALPPLYKFMDVSGAKLTFGNNTFRHAKPSTFNDVEDMTVQSLFPDELKVALEKLVNCFEDVILQHINDEPTCDQPLRGKILQIQQAYRDHPELVGTFNSTVADVYDVEQMRLRSEEYLAWVNDFMQAYRVLCVTTELGSERLWTGYADNHQGVALRIEGNTAKDSKFSLFEPVTYKEHRPPLYDNTLSFAVDSLFGNLAERVREMARKVIYTKTLQWQYEGEYRLAIPLGENEEPYDTLLFHPEEVTELYLGSRMRLADMADVIRKARRLNPNIALFQAERDKANALVFRRL